MSKTKAMTKTISILIVMTLMACYSIAQNDKPAPGTITKKVKGGTITMTPSAPKPKVVTNPWAFLPPVVATVGDQKITKEEFIKKVEAQVPQNRLNLPEAHLKKMAANLANGLVNKTILLQLVAKSDIKPSAKLVKAEFKKMIAELKPAQLQQFKANLAMQKTNIEAYEEKIVNDKNAQEGLAINKWIKENVSNKVKVTDADVEKFYRENQAKFKEEDAVEASHILIKPEKANDEESKKAAKKKAEELLAKIKQGADFGEIAKKESGCPSGKSKNGSLGRFGKGRMVPAFEKAAFALKEGEISGVVETNFGYHIIKKDKEFKGKFTPLAEAKEMIEKHLRTQKDAQALEKLFEVERKKLNVKINI